MCAGIFTWNYTFLEWWTQVGLYLLAISLYVHLQIPFISASFMKPSFSVEETSVFPAFRSSQKKMFPQKQFNAEQCLILSYGITTSNGKWKLCCSNMLLILKVLNWNFLSIGTRKKAFIALDPAEWPKKYLPLNTTALTLVYRLSAIPAVTVIWNNQGRMAVINT